MTTVEPSAETPAAAPSRVYRRRRGWSRWLIEGLLIVVSVLLAFSLAAFRESRRDLDLAVRVLSNLIEEIEYNQAKLQPYIEYHQRWLDALNAVDLSDDSKSGMDHFVVTRPELSAEITIPFPVLRTGAWDAAVSVGALRFIDYDAVTRLSEIYGTQEAIYGMFQLIITAGTDAYNPLLRTAAVQQAKSAMGDAWYFEQMVLDLYEQHLPAIRAARDAME